MSILHEQTLYELGVTQTLCNYLADYLTLKGVPSTSDEGLDTLVPKVLTIPSGGSVEHDDTLNKNGNPDFLHATQSQHDRWTNNYTYKIENKEVTTWVASTAYTGYGFQAQINIPNLTESDIVSVTFAGIDAISGNYYPTIQIYADYILVFSKVNAAITIPTIEITKIEL